LTKGAVRQHLKINACTSGVNPFRKGKRKAEAYTSFEDKRRRLLADSGISSKVKEVTPSADGQGDDTPVEKLQSTGTYELISGGMFTVATLTRGFACKVAKRSNRVYLKSQLDFIQWAYYHGIKGAHGGDAAYKYTNYRAVEEMKLHGTLQGAQLHRDERYWTVGVTADSKATFCTRSLLDKWTFKQWFSNQKAKFDGAIAGARKRQVLRLQDLPCEQDSEDEDDGDE
jgi:hypothetical protein